MAQNAVAAPAPADLEELIRAANDAKAYSHSPYSHFRVGAAILTKSGKIYSGCNVENVAYPLSTCAERTAVVKAVSEGEKRFEKVVITSDVATGFTGPCGSCRQTLAEFGLDMEIHLVNTENERQVHKLGDLLPFAFTPSVLLGSEAN